MFSKAIKMFHEMQVYTKHFEPRMLDLSQTYVKEWSDEATMQKTLPEYVKSALALMKSEMARVELFRLDGSTRRDLLTLLEDHLISRKESRLSTPQLHVFCMEHFADVNDQSTRTNSRIFSKTMQYKILNYYLLSWSDANLVANYVLHS
jgi:hypothetical protein